MFFCNREPVKQAKPQKSDDEARGESGATDQIKDGKQPLLNNAQVLGSQENEREPSVDSSKMQADDNNSEASGMMQMADDQSEMSGMMQQVQGEETSEMLIADLGTS